MAKVNYSPAEVLARVLTTAGLGSSVSDDGEPSGDWPIYATHEPDLPDECITIYDTEGFGGVRDFITKSVRGLSGFQVRVRAADHDTAYDKAFDVYDYLTKTLENQGVSIGSKYYVIPCCEKFGDILDLGKESPNSQRSVCVFNALITVTERPR